MFVCKTCGFDGKNPVGLSKHYLEQENHRPKSHVNKINKPRRRNGKMSAETVNAAAAARFCPCCGFDLQKLNAVMDLLSNKG